MPLFRCEQCQAVDNTALTNCAMRMARGHRLLCSQCDPAIGKWHGQFPMRRYDPDYHTGARGVLNPPDAQPTGLQGGDFVQAFRTIEDAVVAAAGKGDADAEGHIPCPVCKTGQVRYVRRQRTRQHRGYLAFQCSTTACVRGNAVGKVAS